MDATTFRQNCFTCAAILSLKIVNCSCISSDLPCVRVVVMSYVRLYFFCMSVCCFCFFVCLAAFYKHSGYQNNPLLYLYIYPAHCDLIFAWRRRTCNFQYFHWSMKQMCIWIELYWIKFYLLPIGCIGRTLWHNGC